MSRPTEARDLEDRVRVLSVTEKALSAVPHRVELHIRANPQAPHRGVAFKPDEAREVARLLVEAADAVERLERDS